MITSRTILRAILLASLTFSSAAMAQNATNAQGDHVMVFSCTVQYAGGQMPHAITIDLTNNTVTADKVVFVNGQATPDNSQEFVQTSQAGAEWGITGHDIEGNTITMDDFRLSTAALTYGLLSFGALVLSGPCQQTE